MRFYAWIRFHAHELAEVLQAAVHNPGRREEALAVLADAEAVLAELSSDAYVAFMEELAVRLGQDGFECVCSVLGRRAAGSDVLASLPVYFF